MYATHQPIISEYAHEDCENMKYVALLCILSARIRFPRLRDQFKTVKGGDPSPLFAWKPRAWDEMQEEAGPRYDRLMNMWEDRAQYRRQRIFLEDVMLAEVMTWYGLGLIKGGFFLQMCFGVSGCIDTRNHDDFNLTNLEAMRFRSKPATTAVAKLQEHAAGYNSFVAHLGGTKALWDFWCDGYSHEAPVTFPTPWFASAEHCRILGLPTGEYSDDDIPF